MLMKQRKTNMDIVMQDKEKGAEEEKEKRITGAEREQKEKFIKKKEVEIEKEREGRIGKIQLTGEE